MSHEYFWWGPMWIFPTVMPIVMIVILALCLYVLFGRSGPVAGPFQGREETALDILKKRYAKGELCREEFEQMKKDLLN